MPKFEGYSISRFNFYKISAGGCGQGYSLRKPSFFRDQVPSSYKVKTMSKNCFSYYEKKHSIEVSLQILA